MHVTLLWSEKWCELVVTTAFLLVTDVLNLPELFLDKKWWIQDQLDSEDNTCGPVLLYPCTDALFFKSVSSNVSSDLLLQIHQQGGGGVGGLFSQAFFEISPIVHVKFLLRTSYQQRFLKCIFFKRQRFLTLETGQLLLVIEHWSHHDGNLKCHPAL